MATTHDATGVDETRREIITETVEIPVADGTTMAAWMSRPAADPRPTGVVVAHELFGVNPDIRGVVEGLARAGHVTVAPEFYHRHAPAGHWLARDDAGRSEGFALLHRMTRDEAVEDVRAAAAFLASRPGIRETSVVGFSAGGHLAYLAATRLPLAQAAVLYAGWLPSTDIPISRPEPTLDLTPGITGRLLYLVGERDALIDAGQREAIASALRGAGVDHRMVAYPGVEHAFFWPGTPPFDRAARDDAMARVLALLAGDPWPDPPAA